MQEGDDGFTKRLGKAFEKTYLNEVVAAVDPEVLGEATRLLSSPALVTELLDNLRPILKGKAVNGRVCGEPLYR